MWRPGGASEASTAGRDHAVDEQLVGAGQLTSFGMVVACVGDRRGRAAA